MLSRVLKTGLSLWLAISRPLIKPQASPVPRPAIRPMPRPCPGISMAVTTLENAATEPIDRSMPPVRTTSSMPIDMMPKPAIWREMFDRLGAVKKSADTIDAASTRPARMSSVAYSRRRRPVRAAMPCRVRRGGGGGGGGGRGVVGGGGGGGGCAGAGRVHALRSCAAGCLARRHQAQRHGNDVFFAVLRGRQVATDTAVAHHHDAVAHADEFLVIAGNQHDRLALGGQGVDQGVNLGLGAHVDAPRRLVEDEDLALGMEPLCQHHLLLVAPGQ